MDAKSKTLINAIVPLAVLESARSLDRPSSVVLEELPQDFVPKRLGASATVAGQIERYAELAARGNGVSIEEVVQLLRLLARRNDAGLLFVDAGRRAARHAIRRSSLAGRLVHRVLPGGIRKRVGFAMARKIARRVFEVATTRDDAERVTAVGRPPSVEATPEGVACAFYGAGVAELLRTLVGFEGELTHSGCRARGDDACCWRTDDEEAH